MSRLGFFLALPRQGLGRGAVPARTERDLTRYHSDEEVYAAISAVYFLDKAKLLAKAKGYSMGIHLDAGGLLHEAIARTLQGVRGWSRDVDITRHLDQVMRSIRYAERLRVARWRLENSKPFSRLSKDGQTILRLVGVDSYSNEDPTAEELLIERQIYQQIRELHADDTVGQSIIHGLLRRGLHKEDLIQSLGLTDQEYETVLKRVRRRVRKMQELWS